MSLVSDQSAALYKCLRTQVTVIRFLSWVVLADMYSETKVLVECLFTGLTHMGVSIEMDFLVSSEMTGHSKWLATNIITVRFPPCVLALSHVLYTHGIWHWNGFSCVLWDYWTEKMPCHIVHKQMVYLQCEFSGDSQDHPYVGNFCDIHHRDVSSQDFSYTSLLCGLYYVSSNC